jgi:hypothetical protein
MKRSYTVLISLAIGVVALLDSGIGGQSTNDSKDREVSLDASREKAKALVDSGVAKHNAKDTAGAIADWTVVIRMPNAPSELKATALVNRGISMAAAGDKVSAILDLTVVVEMKDVPPKLKAKALFNRAQNRDDGPGIIADCNAVITMKDLPAENEYIRGLASSEKMTAKTFLEMMTRYMDALPAHIATSTATINRKDALPVERAEALDRRGCLRWAMGDSQSAVADWTAVIEMEDAAPKPKADALIERGTAKHKSGDLKGAIGDYTAVIGMNDVPPDLKAAAFLKRGSAKRAAGDSTGATTDYTAIIDMKDATAKLRDQATVLRNVTGDQMDAETPISKP